MTDRPPATCPSCGAPGTYAFAVPQWGVYRCTDRSCGLAFAHPQPTEAWLDAIYTKAFSTADEEIGHGSTPEPYVRHLVDVVEGRLGSLRGRRVLDFGAGIGTFAGVLVERGASVEAIEQGPGGQDTIRSVVDIPVAGTLPELVAAGGGGTFDLIIMVEVIEHLRDPVATLRELRGVLAADGALFVTTPNLKSLRSRLEGPKWYNVASPTHLLYFESRSLAATLRRAGFGEIVELPEAARHPEQSARRRALGRVLQPLGLDGGLQVLARPSTEPSGATGGSTPTQSTTGSIG